jgi:hypothetical protein
MSRSDGRDQLLVAIAKIVCHCDGHIWLSKLDGQVSAERQAIQRRYLNTAETIINMIETEYVAVKPEPTAADYVPKKHRSL